MDEQKRFDNWGEVDCNNCDHYWDSSCDSVQKGSQRPCSSYLATRTIIIPEQIKRLQKSNKCLWYAVSGLSGALLAVILKVMFGG